MIRFEPHLEVLPQAQREVWLLLAPTAKMGLVLYGGTAVDIVLPLISTSSLNGPWIRKNSERNWHSLHGRRCFSSRNTR